jgi:hypothetical protein
MKNKTGFMASKMEDTDEFIVSCFINKPEGNEEQLLAASPIILDAAEWAFKLLETLDEHHRHEGIVRQSLNEEGLRKWAEYVTKIRQVDPNEPLLPRER